MRSDSNEFDVANRKIFPECHGTVENLVENHDYEFRVKAVNEVGNGDPSKPIAARIMDDESKTPGSAIKHSTEIKIQLTCTDNLDTEAKTEKMRRV